MVEQLCLCKKTEWLNLPMPGSNPSKTLDDILPKLVSAKKFSIVDSTKSFFNLSLMKRASLLTTFGNMYGYYCYLSVPMGASLSSYVYVVS